jgi:hypothetical protein
VWLDIHLISSAGTPPRRVRSETTEVTSPPWLARWRAAQIPRPVASSSCRRSLSSGKGWPYLLDRESVDLSHLVGRDGRHHESGHGSKGVHRHELPALSLIDGPRGIDQPDVAECLGKVTQLFPGFRVDLLGEQADVVDVAHGSLEHFAGLTSAARGG